MLCDLLTASRVAGQPHSYLRSQDISYWAGLWGVGEPATAANSVFNQAYLTAMIRAGTADTGVFGLRLMWQSVGEATERFNMTLGGEADLANRFEQAFGSTLFIHLSRRDKVAQAASLVRATQTGLWHMAADGSERERTAPARVPVFDADQITKARDALATDDAGWSSFFEQCGIQPLRLTYEKLADDPQATLATILAALGHDRAIAKTVVPQTAKMADATTTEWLKRI